MATANAAVAQAADATLGEPDPTTVLGIDETRRDKPRWARDGESGRWVRTDAWDTGFVDLAGDQGLGQVTGRTSACVVDWLTRRSPQFRETIRFVAIDPAAVYANAVTSFRLLPNATLVVDHFHIVKLANDAVTKVRRRVDLGAEGPPWPQGRPGLGEPSAPAHRTRRLSPKAFAAMWNSLVDSDPSAQVLTASEQAHRLLVAIGDRLGEVGLQLHPAKTRIVYCKDGRRRGDHEHVAFTFLGFTFHTRAARSRAGVAFTGLLPALSKPAVIWMRQQVRRWRLHRRTKHTLTELAQLINPIVRGWMQYYGAFHRIELDPLLRRITAYLVRLLRMKYRRLRSSRKARACWQRVTDQQPRLLAYWAWETSLW